VKRAVRNPGFQAASDPASPNGAALRKRMTALVNPRRPEGTPLSQPRVERGE
jgi:hypothetical protein